MQVILTEEEWNDIKSRAKTDDEMLREHLQIKKELEGFLDAINLPELRAEFGSVRTAGIERAAHKFINFMLPKISRANP